LPCTRQFGTRIFREIRPADFVAFVDKRQKGNAATTRERYLNTVCAIISLAIRTGQFEAMPDFRRDPVARNPARRARRKVSRLGPHLIDLLLACAHPTIRIQLVIEFVCGARVSSVLHGTPVGNLDLSPGAMKLTFYDTKNDDDVPAALPEESRAEFETYLAWRQTVVRAGKVGAGSDAPLILTYKGIPYVDNGQAWGSQNKTGFNAAKRRARETLRERHESRIAVLVRLGKTADADRARRQYADEDRLLSEVTQHWFRHHLATELGRKDLRAAMRQGGWCNIRSVQGYLIDDAEYQRTIVEERGIAGTNLTRKT
jgi:hypothetical protein